MALNILQLSYVKQPWWKRSAIAYAECFIGGAIGAMMMLLILGWLL